MKLYLRLIPTLAILLYTSIGYGNGCFDNSLGLCFESALAGATATCDYGMSVPSCPRDQLFGTCLLGERLAAVKFHYYKWFEGDPQLECDDSGGNWVSATAAKY